MRETEIRKVYSGVTNNQKEPKLGLQARSAKIEASLGTKQTYS